MGIFRWVGLLHRVVVQVIGLDGSMVNLEALGLWPFSSYGENVGVKEMLKHK